MIGLGHLSPQLASKFLSLYNVRMYMLERRRGQPPTKMKQSFTMCQFLAIVEPSWACSHYNNLTKTSIRVLEIACLRSIAATFPNWMMVQLAIYRKAPCLVIKASETCLLIVFLFFFQGPIWSPEDVVQQTLHTSYLAEYVLINVRPRMMTFGVYVHKALNTSTSKLFYQMARKNKIELYLLCLFILSWPYENQVCFQANKNEEGLIKDD